MFGRLGSAILDGTVMKRKRLRILSIVLILIAPLLMGFGPPGYTESEKARSPLYASEIPKLLAAEPPEVAAAAVVAIDGETGQLLYDKNAHARRAPASMTKVLSAIVALEHGNLQDQVDIKVNGWAMEGSSVMGLTPGEVLDLKGLLIGLMVPSGNDAALAIAEHVGGSVERFVDLMNAKVAELGLKDSHFVNPHGLDDEAHYSSAYDVAQLARYAMRYPVFGEIARMEQAVVEGRQNTYYMKNTNPLLGAYEWADGVKTGYTETAGNCVVGSASREERRVFITLMDSAERARDGARLFDYAFENFAGVSLGLPGSPFYRGLGVGGGQLALEPVEERRVCLPVWQLQSVRSEIRLNADPDGLLRSGQVIGEVVFYPGDLEPVRVPLQVGE